MRFARDGALRRGRIRAAAADGGAHLRFAGLPFRVGHAHAEEMRTGGELRGVEQPVSAAEVEMVSVVHVGVNEHAVDEELGLHRADVIEAVAEKFRGRAGENLTRDRTGERRRSAADRHSRKW